MMKLLQDDINSPSEGFSLLEIIVSIAIIGTVALASAHSIFSSLRTKKIAQLHEAALGLAISKTEMLTTVSPGNLDDTYDLTEAAVSSAAVSNVTFQRVTDVTVNSDGSRTLDVTVTANGPVAATINITNILPIIG